MKRIVSALVLGLATSVAVSWTLAGTTVYGLRVRSQYWGRLRDPARGEGDGELRLTRRGGRSVLVEHSTARSRTGPIPERRPPEAGVSPWAAATLLPWGRSAPWPRDHWEGRVVRGAGWPMIALWHEYSWRPDPHPRFAPNNGEFLTPGGLRIEPSAGTPGAWPVRYPRALPLRPAMPGLAVNTALFAAAWLGLLVGPPRARRWLRRRRGRCGGCGYSLLGRRGDSPCPECGAAADPRPIAPV